MARAISTGSVPMLACFTTSKSAHPRVGLRGTLIRLPLHGCQTAAVSPVVWLTGCDLSLSAVALGKNSNLLCPKRSGAPVAGALNYRHARLLDLRASANLL